MKNYFLISAFTLLLFACKKDELTGDAAPLIGKWKWVYSIEEIYGNPTTYTTITQSSINKIYEVEFMRKGKIIWYEDGGEIDCKRIVFNDSPEFSSLYNATIFDVELNNKKDDFVSFALKTTNDTLLIFGFFPYESTIAGSLQKSYKNFFIRAN